MWWNCGRKAIALPADHLNNICSRLSALGSRLSALALDATMSTALSLPSIDSPTAGAGGDVPSSATSPPAGSGSPSISAVVRVRPIFHQDLSPELSVTHVGSGQVVLEGRSPFRYSHAFGPKVSQVRPSHQCPPSHRSHHDGFIMFNVCSLPLHISLCCGLSFLGYHSPVLHLFLVLLFLLLFLRHQPCS